MMFIAAVAMVAAGFALTAQPPMAQAAKSTPAVKNWSQRENALGRSRHARDLDRDDCIGAPMNRAANFGDRAFYTEQELAERQTALEQQQQADLEETVADNARVGTGPPAHWAERARRPCKQTSLVVDPPNGRTPDLLPEARTRPIPEGAGNNNPKADSPADFSYYIRCISRGVTGSILPVIYGNGQQVVQGPGYVMILQEMVHEARVIPLDGRPHAGAEIRSYMGDPRGHWEGNTLVVETTNFLADRTGIGLNGGGVPTSDALRLTERYTRISADEMRYEVTVDDPKTYVKPFKIGFPLTQEPGYQNFEYACHEGNYAMFDSLSGARAEEKKAAAAAAKKP